MGVLQVMASRSLSPDVPPSRRRHLSVEEATWGEDKGFGGAKDRSPKRPRLDPLPQATRTERVCWGCGQPGHERWECRQWLRQQSAGREQRTRLGQPSGSRGGTPGWRAPVVPDGRMPRLLPPPPPAYTPPPASPPPAAIGGQAMVVVVSAVQLGDLLRYVIQR